MKTRIIIPTLLSLALVACGSDNKSNPVTGGGSSPAAQADAAIAAEAAVNQQNDLRVRAAQAQLTQAQQTLAAGQDEILRIQADGGANRAAAVARIAELNGTQSAQQAELARLEAEVQRLRATRDRVAAEQAAAAAARADAERRAALAADSLRRLQREEGAPVATVPPTVARAAQAAPAVAPAPARPAARPAAAAPPRPAAPAVAARPATAPGVVTSFDPPRGGPGQQQPAPAPEQPGQGGNHQEFLRALDHVNPLVLCRALYVQNDRFFLFFGHTEGSMVITCRQGFGGPERTATATLVGAEAGIGFADLTQEGSFEISNLGINSNHVFGMSLMINAVAGGPEYSGAIGAGVDIKGLSAGFITREGRITRGGGAKITLQIQVWRRSSCGEETLKMLRNRGVTSAQIQASCQGS